MEKTTYIGISFTVESEEYEFVIEYPSLTLDMWNNNKFDTDILMRDIEAAIINYRSKKKIIKPTDEGSMRFNPSFVGY